MRINNNLPALKTFRALEKNNKSLAKSLRSLSTGLRINSSSDDAAGFAVSQKLRAQICGLDVASRNTQDAISMIQTAESALSQTNSMLQRMRDLAVQASNDTLTSQDRSFIQMEIDELKTQIDNISKTTQFNRKKLLDGSCGASWSCDTPGIKARINGSIGNSEGTYRIEISATETGTPQVQTSNIMLTRHDNIMMNKAINYDAGINGISIDNLPDGNYDISASLPSQARAVATGVYGLTYSELDASLKANVRNSYLQNNASILFEVTGVDAKEKTITLNATADILTPDCKLETYLQQDMVLTQGEYYDLSQNLGLGKSGDISSKPDGAFELQLTNLSAFSAGDKFVYNLTASANTDATININSSNTENTNSTSSQTSSESVDSSPVIMRTNTFKPKEPLPSAAKVLFLIDNSGSMGASFRTVQSSISSFLDSIRNEGVNDIKVGVARYANTGITNTSYDWYDNEQDLIDSLEINLVGASVDPYKAITDAVNYYDMSDVVARHIVLITDTGQEVSGGGTFADAQSALSDSGITLSAVSNGSRAITSLITSKGMDLRLSDSAWGTKLVNDLGQKIGRDAINSAISNTPLSEYKEFSGIFPDAESPSQKIRITSEAGSFEAEVLPTDTLESLAGKMSGNGVVSAEIDYMDDPDDGERGLIITLTLEGTPGVKISGSPELVNVMGVRSNSDVSMGITAANAAGKDIRYRNFYVDENTGEVTEGSIVISASTDGFLTSSEYAHIGEFGAVSGGEIPAGDVMLRNIGNFWNTEDVFALEYPQKLGIMQGNGKSAELVVYGTDTLNDLCTKLNDVIANELGQSGSADKNNFVSYVDGKLVINSAIPGREGEIYFSGSEEILNALGLNTIQASSESRFSAIVYDAVSGKMINEAEATGTEFVSLIPPEIDIKADCVSGLSANWNEATKRFMLTGGKVYSAMLSLKESGTIFQTGANGGEEFSADLGDMSSYALGLDGVNVLTVKNAGHAVSVIDRAIVKVSEHRAKFGAYTNALEGTMNNLIVSGSNLTEAESRLRDADMAEVMFEFVKHNILNQTGTAMLSQANQLPQSVLSILQ